MSYRRPSLYLVTAMVVGVLALLGVHGLDTPKVATYSATGGGGPTIAIVHGLGSNAGHWRATAKLLGERHRVVLVELPGHGESAMPEPFSLDRAVTALDGALAAAATGPVVLVGHSVGGLAAAALAIEHPRRVRGLVLVETALRPQVDAAGRAALLEQLERDYLAVLHQAYLGFGRDSAQGEGLYGEVAALDPAHVKRWIRLAVTADLSERAGRLTVPTLAVLAERSWPVGEPWAVTSRALGYDRVPRLRQTRIGDCGHFVMLDQPQWLAQAIERFAGAPEGEPIANR